MIPQANKRGAHAAPPPSLRAHYKQLTNDRLVAAAQDLFTAQGYRATSVAQIAAAAGTTSTTFYRHFKNKGDLAWLLLEQLAVETDQVNHQLGSLSRWTVPAVRAWLNEYFGMWKRIHKLCDAFWEASNLDPELGSSILPRTIATIRRFERIAARPNNAATNRAILRVASLMLSLDRVAYLVDCDGVPPEESPILNVYAPVLCSALQECVAG